MTRPSRPSSGAPMPLERYGLAPRRHRFRVSNGNPALVKDRLETFAAAFLADPRPGLVFVYDRLVLANDAARGLLGAAPAAATDEFLARLKASLNGGSLEPGLRLQTESAVYAPVLQPPRTRRGHSTVTASSSISARRMPPAPPYPRVAVSGNRAGSRAGSGVGALDEARHGSFLFRRDPTSSWSARDAITRPLEVVP